MGKSWTTHTAADGLPATPESTSHPRKRLWSVAIDEDGTAWVAHPQHGLALFDGDHWTTPTTERMLAAGPAPTRPPGRFNPARSNDVSSVAVDREGTVCAATRNGLSAYDGQAWTTHATDDAMASNRLTAVAVAGGDTVWAGTQQHGLSRLDDGEWTTFTADDGLASDRIRALAVAPDGTVWADANDGLSVFDGQSWSAHTTEDGLASDDVRGLVVTEEGTVWAGTRSRGVSRFDDGEWTTFTADDGLAADEVRAVAAGDDGTVWVGHLQARGAAPDAARQGLSAFDGQQATTYSTTDGLAANQVRALTTGPDGTVIADTKAGLSVFDPQ